MKRLVSLFIPNYPKVLVYMLQSTEYQIKPYIQWFWRTKDFSRVMYRKRLVKTKAARLLLLGVVAGMLGQVLLGVGLTWVGYRQELVLLTLLGAVLVATYPLVWAYLVTVPLLLGRWLIINPRQRKLIAASEAIYASHKGVKIAIAGSYGKTTMKELLQTILSEGRKVAATPGNKNVAISHAYFARTLQGDEDIVLIEYGEGMPGDIARFARTTHPDCGIITGVAPAHLDHYPSVQAAGEDIFSLAQFVAPEHLYVNGESPDALSFINSEFQQYTATEVLGWRVSDVAVDFRGTTFTMQKGKEHLRLHSGLPGKHLVGPLALVAALAHELGLSREQIERGMAKTHPFEHRMQPMQRGGAWVIDDTYNGNIEGMKAGLQLLKELPGKRKIYVTPGLVDQGTETERVHMELGKAIAATKPDKVVLMYNSVTDYIEQGLKAGGYQGQLQYEHYPLDFYLNLEHFVASGDVVLLQNDWPDNYN